MKKTSKELRVCEIRNKKDWESFNLSVENSSYFQSWNWGEVQKKNGIEVLRLGYFCKSKLIGTSQIFDIRARRGHYLQVRQGPVIYDWSEKISGYVFDVIRKIASDKGVSYIRISPLLCSNDKILPYLKKIGFRDSPIHNVDAENRWILNLEKESSVIMLEMRKTTRYMIGKAQNMKIDIVRSQDTNNINIFLDIYNETAKTKKFIPHTLIKEEFEEFKKDNNSCIYLAKLNGKILCGAIIIYYGKEAIYRHGATSLEGRNTPASYLVQWEAIKDAKNKGLSIYNFWGISRDDNPKNPWFGLSQFKKGFGGERKDFIHSLDLPIKNTYWLSYLIDYYTKIRRGYI